VLQALAAVREPWREFLRRRYFERQSHEEIARETGYGISTVSSGISRGLDRMRPRVESYARANYGLNEKTRSARPQGDRQTPRHATRTLPRARTPTRS
jgi:hypothetical protein